MEILKPKCIEILRVKNIVLLSFSGTSDPRKNFLKYIREYLILRYMKYSGGQAFITILMEMVKNIYDHAQGKGVISLTTRDGFVFFSVADENTNKVDLENWKEIGFTTGKDKTNKGLGKRLIPELATPENLVFDLQIDVSQGGICYSGKLKLEQKKQDI